MKIVILDGFTENPGDLSWDGFRNLGELDRKSTRLNSSHNNQSRMPSSA